MPNEQRASYTCSCRLCGLPSEFGGASSLFAAKAGEGRLVLGVDGGVGLLAATTTISALAAAEVTATATLATAVTTATATTAATAAALAAESAALGALRLDVAHIDVDGLLGLLGALTLGLAAGGGHVIALIADDLLSGAPLLGGALVGLADLRGAVESGLLLGELSEVVVVGDVLVLRLLDLLLGILSGGILLLSLGDGITGLLVLQLSVALSGTPRLGSLLLRAAENCSLVFVTATTVGIVLNLPGKTLGVTVVTLAREATTTAWAKH